jgi:hypothetical protein
MSDGLNLSMDASLRWHDSIEQPPVHTVTSANAGVHAEPASSARFEA